MGLQWEKMVTATQIACGEYKCGVWVCTMKGTSRGAGVENWFLITKYIWRLAHCIISFSPVVMPGIILKIKAWTVQCAYLHKWDGSKVRIYNTHVYTHEKHLLHTRWAFSAPSTHLYIGKVFDVNENLDTSIYLSLHLGVCSWVCMCASVLLIIV